MKIQSIFAIFIICNIFVIRSEDVASTSEAPQNKTTTISAQKSSDNVTSVDLIKNDDLSTTTKFSLETTTTTSKIAEITTVTKEPDPSHLLIPPATDKAQIVNVNVTTKKPSFLSAALGTTSELCPSFENADSLTQTQLFQRLTHPCRFDRIQRPEPRDEKGNVLPVDVYARAYIYFLHNLDAHDLQFKLQALLQLRYVDPRLVFREVAPNRTTPIVGEDDLRKELWVPHLFFANENESREKDKLTSISPDGTVIISTRIQATLYCSMDLRKFPFDQQQCKTILESWMYNSSEIRLHWEMKTPVTMSDDQHLTEYVLINIFTNETIVNADLSDLRHGAFAGNYSSLTFTVTLGRQMGFYLIDYFLPSMMIVSCSWVSFWLQADQTAPRVMLGTTTMLTFITLASAQGKTLPKVSYVKASEIWFMGCATFIFGSLVEFAFVNIIWRRKKNVELKKVNTTNILKQTLTPRPMRKELTGGGNNGLQKSHSCSSIKDQERSPLGQRKFKFDNSLTVHSTASIPIITTDSYDDFKPYSSNGSMTNNGSQQTVKIDVPESPTLIEPPTKITWTTMTPQQISIWIDKRSRLVFPIAFVIFNIIYWTFVNI